MVMTFQEPLQNFVFLYVLPTNKIIQFLHHCLPSH